MRAVPIHHTQKPKIQAQQEAAAAGPKSPSPKLATFEYEFKESVKISHFYDNKQIQKVRACILPKFLELA